MESISSIFKIGYGPSSSHTMGPAKAAQIFKSKYPVVDYYEVILYGSLALTGKGHMTDTIIKKILINEKTKVVYNYKKVFEYHPNAMEFIAWQNESKIGFWRVFSIGGGDLREEGQTRKSTKKIVYPQSSMNEILKFLYDNNITIIDYIEKFENSEIYEHLNKVLDVMEETVKRGISTEGYLPGGLNVKRKASTFYKKYVETKNEKELVYAYALAVSEENASGNVIVTAPTCGAAAVVPSVLLVQKHIHNRTRQDLIKALMVGGLIGNIIRNNASISGAEVGCQGEVGVACSMASAMLTYLKGGDANTIEYAAEIALEHHLGLTCDPIDGLVQIPCIERNAIAALTSINVSDYAMIAGSVHTVTLDSVIEVMKETGKDLQDKYKETSTGGLALKNK